MICRIRLTANDIGDLLRWKWNDCDDDRVVMLPLSFTCSTSAYDDSLVAFAGGIRRIAVATALNKKYAVIKDDADNKEKTE